MKETPKGDEYKVEYQEQLERLKGREAEFALLLVERIVSQEIFEDLEYTYGVHPERLEEADADYLRKKLEQLYNCVSPLYTITHSMNKAHSCHHVHDPWRDGAIDEYKKLIDMGFINDSFNLFGDKEELKLDISEYHNVCVGEPYETDPEFTSAIDTFETFSDGSINHVELSLIRSKIHSDRFLVDYDHLHNYDGRIVTIDEDVLIAMDAKRRLADD
jgi:hypothetical protein